jgi:hypothetical protein
MTNATRTAPCLRLAGVVVRERDRHYRAAWSQLCCSVDGLRKANR